MTVLDICNMALSALGHDETIESLDDPGKEAKLCSTWYPSARKKVLGATNWAGLVDDCPVRLGTPDTASGLYAYWPAQPYGPLLRLKAYTPTRKEVDITISKTAILSREPRLLFTWVRDEEDPDLWPQGVADAVILELASRIAMSLTGKRSTATDVATTARTALSTASAINANLTRRHGTDNPYVDARRGED